MFKRNWKTALVALILLAGGTLYYYSDSLVQNILTAVLMLNLLNLIFRSDKLESSQLNQPFVDNPLEVIVFSKDHLRVNGETIELNKITKLVLDIENGRGVFQLPYNNGGKIMFNFPAKYLYKLRQKFQHHLPEVNYIN